MSLTPSRDEFLRLLRRGNLVPVYREVLGDLETPVSAYFKTVARGRYSFLLESVEGEEKVARYSFLAADPELLIRCRDGRVEVVRLPEDAGTPRETETIQGSPFENIRRILSAYRFVPVPGLPPFCGGIVGYIGYDTVRFFERLGPGPVDDLGIPDMELLLTRRMVVFDHRNHRLKIISCAHVPEGAGRREALTAYEESVRWIETTQDRLRRGRLRIPPGPGRRPSVALRGLKANMTRERFERAVRKAKRFIRDGEIIQVVLSQRFETPMRMDPFQLYRMLRSVNPSPYMYMLDFGKTQIVGSSPEMLVRCQGGTAETRPIAGTRPRGRTDREDDRLAAELAADAKERAEHVMLVDLGRNDLGRVCRRGTVAVTEFMKVERYSHVMHLVSNVRGRIRKGVDALDVLQAAFPAGTVSGAPKIRAMEIIDELEPVSRGPYAGCIGYFSFSGDMDSCITIRTIVVHEGKAYIQAGAGIVADSRPHREYLETVNKAEAQLTAVEMALKEFSDDPGAGLRLKGEPTGS